jgi:hypothetical protein
MAEIDAEWKVAANEVWESWDRDVSLHSLDYQCTSSGPLNKSHFERALLFWLTDTPDLSNSVASRRNPKGESRKQVP